MLITTIKDSRLEGSINLMVDLVARENRQFVVERSGKPIAWVIPEKIMRVIEYIVKNNPLLADELVIEADGMVSRSIQESRAAMKKGQKIPIEDAFL